MGRLKKTLNTLIGFSILLSIWQVTVLSGRYEKWLMPSPLDVASGLNELITEGILTTHIMVSMYRFLVGYLTAVVSGIVLGLIFGWFSRLWSIVDPVVQVLRPISPIAWFPFIVLWFGIGDIPAIVIIYLAAFYPVLLSTISSVRRVDRVYLKVAENFGIKQPYIMTKIVLPAAFPQIATGLHIALGSAWVFLVAGEMVGAQSGLGYLIIDSRNSLRTDLVLAGIVCIGLLGLLLDKSISRLEKWIGKNWGVVPDETA